ncbi:hypothetical protein P872_14895 [Rhodonellum psychrophilum GCM71 = DSM 17998]|uniref:Polysaccharide polymerase n=2 Tax=Rhodonellum TaxID=336827 RepID=U5BUQ0_9BACT|nr:MULTISPECIES: hypothetical protein [Rhodonellum]ERM84330.1 hypothetical protein P872_14895 [Rhodonellum psychrophilum GCM71 = DSM 17998]SDZ43068.1 hypothetical protein SAMN05444412_11462 [Rhodonellum ikkaensis]
MNVFFLLLEFSTLLFMGYAVMFKKQLSIVYLPFLFFSNTVYVPALPYFFYYVVISSAILYFAVFNLPFVIKNVFAVFSILYILILLTNSTDIISIRPALFFVIWLFLLIPIIPEIFQKFSRNEIMEELSKCAFLILTVFIVNTVLSTKFAYVPVEMYGINSGILFGNVTFTDFNVLVFATYIVLKKAIKDKKNLYLMVYLVAMFLILLSMRRTVMLLSVLGSLVVIFELLDFQNIKKFIAYGVIIGSISLVVVFYTGFLNAFWERYEKRGLENRSLNEENRMMEFNLLYKDMFVFFDYSPWFGYELFQSGGNYGKGVFGTRTLHTDLTNIVHSSGFLGLFLYLMMVSLAFRQAWLKTYSKSQYYHFAFCSIAFVIFTITGRYTTLSSSIFFYLVLFLPVSKPEVLFQKVICSRKVKSLEPLNA